MEKVILDKRFGIHPGGDSTYRGVAKGFSSMGTLGRICDRRAYSRFDCLFLLQKVEKLKCATVSRPA
jgi:hypothetical protein